MSDRVLANFLQRQFDDAVRLNAASDLAQLIPLAGEPPQRYLIEFRCKGLVKAATGAIEVAERFVVSVSMGNDYLRSVRTTFEVLTWVAPANIFHPNVSRILPLICIGPIAPGTGLVELTYRLFDLITYRRVTMNERNALCADACRWARHHTNLFPIDARPLKRRPPDFEPQPIEVRK